VRKAIVRAATQGRGGKGCVVVAAAGNDGGGVLFPATLSVVIAVAGCDEHGRLMRTTTWASNFGPEVDLTAPAMETFTTDLDGTYTCSFQGTSAATALVAGAAALVLQQNPELTAKEVRDLLLNTADLVHDTANGRRVALKIVNVEAAVRAAQP
jgi:subtilisin family serine protease